MTARRLRPEDIRRIATGALFLSCAIDHEPTLELAERTIRLIRERGAGPRLVDVGELPADALAASIGFVNNGLPVAEMLPVGDEFETSLTLLEARLGEPLAGIYPLAAANMNAIVPLFAAALSGRPVIDADPMGRVFPLMSQTTLALAGVPAGPVAVTGPVGETAVLDVLDPTRAERLVRALAGEFGGWAATASYPVRAGVLAAAGVPRSLSRLEAIGGILELPAASHEKHARLGRLLALRKPVRARVADVEGLSRPSPPDQPDRPSSATLVDDAQGRIIRLEIQNEILMMLIDGAVEAVVPDVVTMLRASDGAVASLDDLWVGNRLDLLSFPADDPWPTPAGLQLAGPTAMHFSMSERRRRPR